MWLCTDIFYEDEEEGCGHPHSDYSAHLFNPEAKQGCYYTLCRMCANEKIGSEVGDLN